MRVLMMILPATCLALALMAPARAGVAGEGNLVANPGFEEAVGTNAYTGWTFVDHGQDFARGVVHAQDYKGGLKAATVVVPRPLKVYVSWAQHIRVKEDAQLPDEVSLWYRAPEGPCQVVLSYTAVANGKSRPRGVFSLKLEQTRDWRRAVAKLEPPFGTRDILLELRVTRPGTYAFDDVSLIRREMGAATGKPHRLLFVGRTPNDTWQEPLAAAGFERVSTERWDNLTAELLRECRAVVLAGLPGRQEVTPEDEAIVGLLLDYVRAGGGLLLTQQSEQQVTGMTLCYHLAERLGTRILFEKIVSDPALTRRVGPWGSDTYTFSDRVSGPVAEDVKGVFYHSRVDMGSYAGVLPFLPEKPWQVVLSAGANSRSEPTLLGLDELDRNSRAQGFASEVPLAGVREMGKGRVAYIGMHGGNVFARPLKSDDDRKVHRAYLLDGAEGWKSDLLRFYVNTFRWLSGNADAVGNAALVKKPPAAGPGFTTAWKLHRGIIGARTTHSSGKSTPAEYAAGAKAAGLDFIVFLEEFAELKPGGFEALKKECRALSGGGFLAVPGITYQNTDGNNEYAFGSMLKLPSRSFLDEGGKRFRVYEREPEKSPVCLDQTWIYQLLGFDNCSGWYLFSRNPYPHFDARDVNSMAIVTQEDGRTVERVPQFYGEEARNGQYLWPMALTLMKSAGEIDLITRGTYFCNVVGAEGIRQLYDFINLSRGRQARHLYPGAPPFGSISVTTGPVIQLSMPRGDTDAEGDIYNARLQEWDLDLKVAAAAGLKEVLLMDGDRSIRRFLPKGATEFAFKGSLARERQKHIWVHATDARGGEAFSRDIQSDSWLLREYQCADRNNQLLYSMQRRADGTPFYIGYGGETCLPDKGPWNGRTRPVGCFVFDEKLGVGAMAYDGSPENHPQVFFNPHVVYDGKRPESVGWSHRLVPEREGAPHVRPHRVVASSEVLVGERVLDGVFPVEAKPVIHVWHTIYPVKPSEYLKTTARVTHYLVKPDGIAAYLWDQSFEVLQNIPVKEGTTLTLCLGRLLASTATERVLVAKGVEAERGPVKGRGVSVHPFDRGDYLGLLKSPFGSFVAYSLTDGLVLEGDGVNYQTGFQPDGPVLKRGTRLRARVLLVGMHRMVADPAALAARVSVEYGLGREPAYKVDVRKGSVVDREYVLRTRAGGGCFTATLTGVKEMAGNLGCTVEGLNDGWTALFHAGGADGKTRILPVEEGTAYAVIRAEEEGVPLFVGHPFTAGDPSLVLSLTRTVDWKRWQLEIHNPTDRAITTPVESNPAFPALQWREKVTVPAGRSIVRGLGPAGADAVAAR